MKQIKSYHVLFYVAGVVTLLSPVVFLAPKDGWDFWGLKVNFLSQEDLYHPKEQEKKDISNIVLAVDTSMVDIVEDPDVKHKNGSKGNLGAPNGGELSASSSTELQMSDAGRENLHRFFEVLAAISEKKEKISILHYGDSQIEGDRMTGYIRQRIQDQFGGNGPGLIPATNVYSTNAFIQSYSESFRRYTCFGGDKLNSKKYGAMGSASRFTAEYKMDSTFRLDTIKVKKGWIEIAPSGSAFSRAKQFNNVKMHYNSCVSPTAVKVYQGGNLIHEEDLVADGAQHTMMLDFEGTPGKLRYEFEGKISPNICGFSLEGDYGVQVSNIGMRGSSGTIFGSINHGSLSSMYSELNVKLVIMQFGGNSIPSFKDSSSVRNYASYFKGQINTIKKLIPGAMIIVIGPSDMSKFKDGIYETYSLLPYCVSQMKSVAKSAGAGYWDLYAAMGGENSMPAWVEKGLAGKDYIHFSVGGAKVASQLFYDAFIAEYAKWKGGSK